MYLEHFGLQRRPFDNCMPDDNETFFPSDVHRSTMLKLRYAVEARRAAAALIGDPGIGKSLLVDALATDLPDSIGPIAKILFPQMPSEQLLAYIADQLSGTCTSEDAPARRSLSRIDEFLSENLDKGRQAVLIVDDAHLLSSSKQLDTLRSLLNLQRGRSPGDAALTLLLSGGPELATRLQRNPSLDGKIAVKCVMQRMTQMQTAAFVQHRLAAAGCHAQIFSEEALTALHHRSAGIPGRINRLADLALMVAFAENATRVEPQNIDDVHQELIAAA